MTELVINDAEKFNEGKQLRFHKKKGNVIKVSEAEAMRLINAGIADLTPEEKELRKEKVKKKENKGKIFLNLPELHPAGGIRTEANLVYEPIGEFEYVWKCGDKRGISKAKWNDDAKTYTMEIDGNKFTFKDKPLNKIVFKVPHKEQLNKWIIGEIKSKTGKEVYGLLKKYIKVCLDLPQPYYYDLTCLASLQSWVVEIVNTVVFFSIVGKFGSGKTVVNECLEAVCKHGVQSSSISPPAMPRITEQQKLCLMMDEIDVKTKTKDSEVYQFTRQSYRRGNLYIRWNNDTKEPDVCEPFGMKTFSLHGGTEKALSTRAVEINIGETDDTRLPIINQHKGGIGQEVLEYLFFWYVDNILTGLTRITHLTHLTGITLDNACNAEDIRQQIYDVATEGMDEKYLDFLKTLRGRNVELAYVALFVCNVFDLDIFGELAQAFKKKQMDEEEFGVSTYTNILRELLCEMYEDNKDNDKSKKDGLVFVVLTDTYKTFNDKLSEKELKTVSYNKFAEYLNEMDFLEGVNKKRELLERKDNKGNKKNRFLHCLFFDSKVLKNIGVDSISTPDKSDMSVKSVKPVKSVNGEQQTLQEEEPVNIGNNSVKCEICGNSVIPMMITTDSAGRKVCTPCQNNTKQGAD